MNAPRVGAPWPLPRRPMRPQAVRSTTPRRTLYATNGTLRAVVRDGRLVYEGRVVGVIRGHR